MNNIDVSKKQIMNINTILTSPIKVKFDIRTLDMVLSFIYKDSVLKTRKVLSNMYKLFTNLDSSLYSDNVELKNRIWIIQKSLEGKLKEGFEDNEALKEYCIESVDCDVYTKELVEKINTQKIINHEESKFLLRRLGDTLEFGYIVSIKEIIQALLDKVDDDDFKSYKSVQEDIMDISTAIVNIKRNNSSARSGQMFSLDTDIFDNVIEDSLQKLKDRNRIFITGIKRLNTFLSPGFMSKRLYIFMAFPGKGKSTMLLKAAIDIKRYNKGIKTKDPDKRPAVLVLILENDIPETIERIYNMTVDSDDIRNYSVNQVKKKLRTEGHLSLTDDDNINIIMYEYKNRELDTNDLYGIINDLADDGIETVALILDYIKRIRPAEKAETEKEELKNISNELKELAKFYDLPVISAQQLNRAGASVVDAAIQANKEDVTRLVGRDSIAGALTNQSTLNLCNYWKAFVTSNLVIGSTTNSCKAA